MKRSSAFGIALSLGLAALDVAFAQQSATPAWNTTTGTAYVANGGDASGNGGSLSLIDLENLNVVATLSLGGYPLGVALAPGRDRAYVTDFSSDFVWVIDTRSLEVLTMVAAVPSPGSLAITPDGDFLYVLSLSSGAISVIDTETNSLVTTISVPTQELLSLAITPDGRFAYATDCCSDNNVTVIDTRTNTVATQIPLAGGPSGIAITPNGRFVFVEDSADVSVIDTQTNKVVDTIPGIGGCGPTVALTPDGLLAYVENYCGNTVSVVDTRTRTLVTNLTTNTPIGAAFSPGGTFVFIANNNCLAFPCTVPGTVSVLETANNNLVDIVTVGFNPQDIAMTPKHRRESSPAILADVRRAGRHIFGRAYVPCQTCRR